jgi:hypothetical protein
LKVEGAGRFILFSRPQDNSNYLSMIELFYSTKQLRNLMQNLKIAFGDGLRLNLPCPSFNKGGLLRGRLNRYIAI